MRVSKVLIHIPWVWIRIIKAFTFGIQCRLQYSTLFKFNCNIAGKAYRKAFICTCRNKNLGSFLLCCCFYSCIYGRRINRYTISNCTVKNSVVYTTGDEAAILVGGVAGASGTNPILNVINSTVENCIVDAKKAIGGLVGAVSVGTVSFTGCKVINTFVSGSNSQVGAIVGRSKLLISFWLLHPKPINER